MLPSFQKKEVLTFRCFSRKGYALFACLHREVRIGVLSAATLLSAAPRLCAGGAQLRATDVRPDSATTLQLKAASVSGTRAPLAAEQAARMVTTLTREDIAAAAVASVNDLLKLAAGVDVRQRGAFGIQTDVSVDGGTFDQIAILLNGVPFTHPQTGHLAVDLPVDLSDIERVEILRGAAARVFGTQAFSGAINVVTSPAGRRVQASVEGGSYGTAGVSARGAYTHSTWSNALSAGYRRSDGATENSDFQQTRAFYQGRYAHPDLRADWQIGVSTQDYGANTFYSAAYPNQWEATRRYSAALKAETRGRVRLTPTLSWLRSTDHFQLVRGTPAGENFHRSDVFTAGLSAWTDWALGRTAIGAELRQEGILSTTLGQPLDEAQLVPVRGEDVRYTRRDNRTNISYYLEHNVAWRGLTASVGVMANRNTALDERFRWYPGVDLSYRAGRSVTLFASWNRALRLPTFTDLYYQSPTLAGNVGLRPERTEALRGGAKWSGQWWAVEIAAFHNRGTDMIDWVMYDVTDKYHSANFCLTGRGVSASAVIQLDRWLGDGQPLRRLSVDYAYLHQSRDDSRPVYKSNYALEYLRHKLVARLSHRVVSHLEADWSLRWQDRMGGYLAYAEGQATGEIVPYGPNAVLDVRLRWEAPRYTLRLDLNNVTAHRYYDLGNVPQPGFTLMAGAAWHMDLH